MAVNAYLFTLLLSTLTTVVLGEVAYKTNQALVNNEAEGLRLLAEYQTLLAKQNTQNKKTFTAEISKLKQKSVARTAAIKSSGSSNARLLVSSLNLGLNPSSSTCTKRCCKVIVPPGSQTRTRVATRTLSTRHHSNYKCGLWGWRRCGRDTTRYHRSYFAVKYEVSVPRPCPSYALTCCTNYVWFEGCCISLTDLRNLLQKMRNSG